ncbi:MAG TPA: carboxypeptidase-like regulatory domain-containing protein [Blastocatellia bacterium]|nr:carboxypeptidase-like regulatory domain-containing protein [Blastocatellia bacterium]
MKKRLSSLVILMLAISMPARSQDHSRTIEVLTGASSAPATQTASRRGTARTRGAIRGRVTSNDGQPLTNARVMVRAFSSQSGPVRYVSLDEKGEFHIDDLAPAVYGVMANLPGYIESGVSNLPRYLRLGDNVTITLTRGGVITGTVTGMNGEPVVGLGVRVMQVRDAELRPLRIPRSFRSGETDDRGVYRVYGLPPGAYHVIANGTPFLSNQLSAYAEDVPTYYPSATRDTASEVMVQMGQEVTGIDIRYRGERGQAISGTISGGLPSSRPYGVSVALINAATNATESSTFIQPIDPNRAFAFYGVPDGEYEVFAQTSSIEGAAVSPARRVIVKGSDVTGIELALAPLASVSGRVVIEQQASPALKETCKARSATHLEENLLTFMRDDKSEVSRPRRSFSRMGWSVVPSEAGEFQVQAVEAGQYHLKPAMLGESWYVRSLTLALNNKNSAPQDLSTTGLSVKAGERVAGVTISLAEGGASIEGRAVLAEDSSRPPSWIRVILVPVDKENRDNLLRYEEVAAQKDGTFKIGNIAPGRYWIVTQQTAEPELSGEPFRPMVWDAGSRAEIRSEAEKTNLVVELKPCQKMKDYILRVKAQPRKSGPRRPF